MQLKKKLIPFTVVIGLALAGSAMAQEVIKIGHVGPTSGPIAHAGKDIENGARMAIDELNAKGITLAGKKVKFELLAEDDAADPKQGNIVAQKLVDAKVSGVVGHLNSAPPSRLQKSISRRASRKFPHLPLRPNTPNKALRARFAWWPMMAS